MNKTFLWMIRIYQLKKKSEVLNFMELPFWSTVDLTVGHMSIG